MQRPRRSRPFLLRLRWQHQIGIVRCLQRHYALGLPSLLSRIDAFGHFAVDPRGLSTRLLNGDFWPAADPDEFHLRAHASHDIETLAAGRCYAHDQARRLLVVVALSLAS